MHYRQKRSVTFYISPEGELWGFLILRPFCKHPTRLVRKDWTSVAFRRLLPAALYSHNFKPVTFQIGDKTPGLKSFMGIRSFSEEDYSGNYAIGDYVASVSGLRPSNLYILRMPKHRIYLIRVTKTTWHGTAIGLSASYRIVDPENLSRSPKHINSFEFVLRDSVELSPSAFGYEIYEAEGV